MGQKGFSLPDYVSPIEASLASMTKVKPTLEVPDIIEFVLSDKYLGRPNLYPRQATLLKTIFLQDELYTDYDYQVLEEWTDGFSMNPNPNEDGVMRFQGTNGIQPDVLQRIHMNKAEGRKWFRECVVVIGRRGGKGYLGGLCGAYVLWNYLAKGDPQGYYGVDRDKRLVGLVFAGKLNQAKTEQWADLAKVIQGGPCFSPYISRVQAESISIYAPNDVNRLEDLRRRGIDSDVDYATFQILPKESTMMSGRGPAAFMQYYDEMAHVSTTTAKSSAEMVYQAATPALDQFKQDAFLYEGSSPWQMSGQFYDNWLHSLEVDYATGKPIYPEMLMVQLASWDPYKDWDKAPEIKMRRGWKRRFQPLQGAVQEYDDKMRRLERANPETFAVERRSQWAASQNAYLNPDRVRAMFGPYEGENLQMQSRGDLHKMYVAHIDPSKSGANTALAVAHLSAEPDERGFHHVIFDLIKHWVPGDFDGQHGLPDNNKEIDYIYLEEWWNKNVTDVFMPSDFTFDQFDHSIIQRVRKYARDNRRPKSTKVYERTATKSINWSMAEAFKTALGLGIIHAPFYEQAEQEMIYLQDMGHERVDHPTEGPIQTKDVFDAIANVVYTLIGEEMSAFLNDEFSGFGLSGYLPGGVQPFSAEMSGADPHAEDLFSQFREMNTRRGEQYAYGSPSRRMDRDRPAHWSPSNPFR